MKPIKLLILPVAIIGVLSGCAVQNDRTELQGLGLTYQSEVKKLEDDTFYVEVEAAPGAGRTQGAVNAALNNASNYCLAMDKGIKKINVEVGSDRLVNINGVAKIIFECK